MKLYTKQQAAEELLTIISNIKEWADKDGVQYWQYVDTGEILLKKPAVFLINTYGLSEPITDKKVLGEGHEEVAEDFFLLTKEDSEIYYGPCDQMCADFSVTDISGRVKYYSIGGVL